MLVIARITPFICYTIIMGPIRFVDARGPYHA